MESSAEFEERRVGMGLSGRDFSDFNALALARGLGAWPRAAHTFSDDNREHMLLINCVAPPCRGLITAPGRIARVC